MAPRGVSGYAAAGGRAGGRRGSAAAARRNRDFAFHAPGDSAHASWASVFRSLGDGPSRDAGFRAAGPGRLSAKPGGGMKKPRVSPRLHSLEVPLDGLTLIVPSAAVAEVINPLTLAPVPFSQPWLKGVIGWGRRPGAGFFFRGRGGRAAAAPA